MQISSNKLLLSLIEAAKKVKVSVLDLTMREYGDNGEFSVDTLVKRFGSWERAKRKASKSKHQDLRQTVKKDELDKAREKKKEEILSIYLKYVRKNGSRPKVFDMASMGVSKDVISRAFGSMSNLDDVARGQDPDAFSDVYISSLFSPAVLGELDDTIKSYSRFIITTAVTGCKVHDKSFKSTKVFCEANDAALMVLVSSDPTHNMDKGDTNEPVGKRFGTIDKVLKDEIIILKDVAINDNLRIDTLKTSAKMIDPSTGVGRFGQRNGSLIIASPKQRQKVVPVSNFKLPHVIMTTGAITLPDYTTGNYMSERLAKIAEHDHQLGAIIVEVEDKDIFHFRQVQFDENGCFYDIAGGKATKYTPDGIEEDCKAAALVLGDLHSGETDPAVMESWKDVAEIVKPDYVVVHDGFNGMSINHHEENDYLLKAQRAMNNELSLEDELKVFAEMLETLNPMARKSVVVVKSNHDDFLERYLRSGKYVEDPQNHYISLKLAQALLEGVDPLQYAVESLIGFDEDMKIRWLARAEDFKIARIQLGAHGDKGPNGSKGNLASMEASYGQCITGHSHTAEILRGAWSVGTSSFLKLSYNKDCPSSWMNTSCILWPNGQRQLINSIAGSYRKSEI